MTHQEQVAALKALTFDIAVQLSKLTGKVWTFEPQDDSVYQTITGENQAKLSVHFESRGYSKPADRVSIGGSLSVGKNGAHVEVYERVEHANKGWTWEKAHVNGISVALARGPEVIAKEVSRRLLPEYFRILQLAQKQVADSNTYESAVTANLKRLATAAGTLVPTDENKYNRDIRTSLHVTIGEVYGTIQASNNTAQLELRCLPIEQAEYILQYLKQK